MSSWSDYKREETESRTLTGKQRCVIVKAEEKLSRNGNPMIEITVRPSGCRFNVRTWLVKNDSFNKKATAFFDAFPEIGDGNFTFIEWVGCEGAAMFGEDDNGYLELKYFISPERARNLPPFEGEKPEKQTVTSLDDDDDFDDDEVPF